MHSLGAMGARDTFPYKSKYAYGALAIHSSIDHHHWRPLIFVFVFVPMYLQQYK